MTVEKYKICPNPKCGKHNKSKAIECAWCETDLSGVKPTDDETEAARAQAEAQKEQNKNSLEEHMAVPANHVGRMTRICESCGAHNPANARKCSCGEDISDVIPTIEDNVPLPETNCHEQKGVSLVTLDGSYSFSVPEGTTVIGREKEMKDYLTSKPFVSRTHAELDYMDGRLMIKNLSKTNFTYVNNTKISENTSMEIKAGDEIGLGGNIVNGERQELAAYFIVKSV